MPKPPPNPTNRIFALFALILAGEMVFSLPFHLPRFFRPTFLDVFHLSNTQLGDAFAAYGAVAMLAYLLGGPVADRVAPRILLSLSLLATAAGGLYLATFPGFMGLVMVMGFWGASTILFFWSALIRATREWGGEVQQGRAFGFLDGGRGLVAAVFATAAVGIFRWSVAGGDATADAINRSGLRSVIWFYCAATASAAVLIWFFLPPSQDEALHRSPISAKILWQVIRLRKIWLQAFVVLAAYCGYKGLDNFALYAVEVLDKSPVEAAELTSMAAYLRPVAAISAGFLADRFTATRTVGINYLLFLISNIGVALIAPSAQPMLWLIANIVLSFTAVYALRGIYFALLEETKVVRHYTGTAVGIISFVGFLPDFFFAAIAGRILDAAPGLAGHQHYYLFLAGFGFLGLVATILLIRQLPKTNRPM